ncbi:hypothetical protein WSM22_17170 [Cytophagales bacterium WSM2-2]|nr:hypothetical protein WSM22_17170 [Cytophagales bacterium WSM2-2]
MNNIGLFIDIEFTNGGSFQYNQGILEALISLPKEDFKLTVFYSDLSWASSIPNEIESIHLPYSATLKKALKIIFGIGTPDFILRFLFSLTSIKKLGNSSYDLIFFPSQDLAGLFASTRAVNVIHDLMHRYESQFKEASGGGRSKYRDRLFSGMAKKSSVLLVDSIVGKRQVIESYPVEDEEKIKVLPYVAPLHIVQYEDKNFKDYFESLNLPPKFIFYPAQFWPHKNHQILLDAALLLRDKIEDLNFVFTGHKNYEFEKLHEFCTRNKLSARVRFLGFVPNEVLGGFYLRARALMMPTHFGPTNIPPLEAIALKCPVGVSRIYGMPEQLKDAAIYFDNKNVNDVSKAMEALWTDDSLCNLLSRNAEKHFNQWNPASFNRRVCEIITESIVIQNR